MSAEDFNQLVELAMEKPGLAAMRPVVEKEILHYDILQALDTAGILKNIVFQGGTSLRLCRGSQRFSEDLDFAGGKDFTSAKMAKIKECIELHIGERYGLKVTVKEPKSGGASQNVKINKWEISVETTPGNVSMPRQRIKLEVANIPAYTSELMPVKANYDFLAQTNQVLVLTETLSEIMADKVVAFPTSFFDNKGNAVLVSSNKIRHRDIWDLAWIAQQGAALNPKMVVDKINDHGITDYQTLLLNAIDRLPEIAQSQEFKGQMRRFIDAATFDKRLSDPKFLDYLITTVNNIFQDMKRHFWPVSASASSNFTI